MGTVTTLEREASREATPLELALRTLRWHVRELADLSQMAMVADQHDLAQELSDVMRVANDLFAKLAHRQAELHEAEHRADQEKGGGDAA